MPSAFLIRLLALGAAFLAFGAFTAYRMHAHDQIAYNALQAEFDTFRGGVEALGKAAAERTRLENLANDERKRNADQNHAAAVAALTRTITGLRAERAKRDSNGGFVPQASTPSGGLKLACYNAAKLDDALRILDRGVQGLVAEGDAAIVDLNAVKAWAH